MVRTTLTFSPGRSRWEDFDSMCSFPFLKGPLASSLGRGERETKRVKVCVPSLLMEKGEGRAQTLPGLPNLGEPQCSSPCLSLRCPQRLSRPPCTACPCAALRGCPGHPALPVPALHSRPPCSALPLPWSLWHPHFLSSPHPTLQLPSYLTPR
jgi:hypothetical protein